MRLKNVNILLSLILSGFLIPVEGQASDIGIEGEPYVEVDSQKHFDIRVNTDSDVKSVLKLLSDLKVSFSRIDQDIYVSCDENQESAIVKASAEFKYEIIYPI